jgi:hypothetical protein
MEGFIDVTAGTDSTAEWSLLPPPLRKAVVVIEMRGRNHAKAIREYEITSKGVVILGNASQNIRALSAESPYIRVDPARRKSRHRSPGSTMKGDRPRTISRSNGVSAATGRSRPR